MDLSDSSAKAYPKMQQDSSKTKSVSNNPSDSPSDKVQQIIKGNNVVIFAKQFCPYCMEVQRTLENSDIKFCLVMLDRENEGHIMQEALQNKTKSSGVPYVFINGRYVGGLAEILEIVSTGMLNDLLNEYDLIVIGGGSAGIAAAKEAAKFGKSVALINYSKPTQHGNRWVLGGRAVNIGELPRKLVYRASLFKDDYKDAQFYGWGQSDENSGTEAVNKSKAEHTWDTLVTAIKKYILGMSWRLKKELREVGVTFYDNWRPEFVDHHTLTLYSDCGKVEKITGRVVVIATGTTAITLDVIGVEESVTPDELFYVEGKPERVLVIGNGNDGLEIATAMNGLGSETTILVKKKPLGNGLDQDIANKIKTVMVARGVHFLEEDLALKKITPIENTEGGVRRVEGIIMKDENSTGKKDKDEEDHKKIEMEGRNTIENKEKANDEKIEATAVAQEKKDDTKEETQDKKDGTQENKIETKDEAKEGQVGGKEIQKYPNEEKEKGGQQDGMAEITDGSKTTIGYKPEETENYAEEFDLVIYAGARRANIDGLGLLKLPKFKVSPNCKITVDALNQTSVPNIFAIGSVADRHGCPTSSASLSSHSGKFLVRRFYNFTTYPKMPLKCSPSRVLTPVEYAFVGVTEDTGKKLFGEIQTFHNIFTTEESGLSNRFDCRSYVKVICTKVPAIGHQVVGLHLMCPNASEMIQGFIVGYQNGTLTKENLDKMVAVHPIAADIFTNLTVVKESGKEIGLKPF